jgi:hypothetical protein
VHHGLANNITAYKSILSLITNSSVRHATTIAILNRYPNMRLKCCERQFCFLCGSAEGRSHSCTSPRARGKSHFLPYCMLKTGTAFNQKQVGLVVDGLLQDMARITRKDPLYRWDTVRNIQKLASVAPGVLIPDMQASVQMCDATFSCSVCMDNNLSVRYDLFKGCYLRRPPTLTACTGCVCKTCALAYISTQVHATLYTVAPIKCACCGSKLPTAVWQRELKKESIRVGDAAHILKHNDELNQLRMACKLTYVI